MQIMYIQQINHHYLFLVYSPWNKENQQEKVGNTADINMQPENMNPSEHNTSLFKTIQALLIKMSRPCTHIICLNAKFNVI
jgi:hypothetical protein